MSADEAALDELVTALVPSLSRSLAEQFNVFRVMHHGTHEKQLSNVFAWLLDEEGTHNLGDVFQRIFVHQVNQGLPADSLLPDSGFQVDQEVSTRGPAGGGDIADIVLDAPGARVVVENYEFSDGHGHDYGSYESYGAAGGRSAVVLLCAWRQSALQTDGWERAVVVTYPELLQRLKSHIDADAGWQRANPRQHAFIHELVQHYTEGQAVVSGEDQIAFIKAMCDTGESARYGYTPHDGAADEFAELLALHARTQFQEGRKTLKSVKTALKRYAERTVVAQLNEELPTGRVTAVTTPFAGKWEWCVEFVRADAQPRVYLEFGPTAVVEQEGAPHPVIDPDYTKVFATRQQLGPGGDGDGIDQIVQSEVGLDEVLAGLGEDDARLRDALLGIIHAE